MYGLLIIHENGECFLSQHSSLEALTAIMTACRASSKPIRLATGHVTEDSFVVDMVEDLNGYLDYPLDRSIPLTTFKTIN